MSEITSLVGLVPNTVAHAEDLNVNFNDLKIAHNAQESKLVNLVSEDNNINALIDIDQADIIDLALRVTIIEGVCSTNSIDIGNLQSDKLNLSGGIMSGILEVIDGVDETDAVNLGQVEELISEIVIPTLPSEFVTISDKTTGYTLRNVDNNTMIRIDSATPVNLTIPAGLTLGLSCLVKQIGVGDITFVGSTTMTISSFNSHIKTAGVGAVASLLIDNSTTSTTLAGEAVIA